MSIEVRSKNLNCIRAGQLQAKFSADGTRILRYFIDFWHNELDLHKELSAPELYILQGKVDALMAAWDKRLAEHHRRKSVLSGKELAEQMTIDATAKIEALAGILGKTLTVDDRIKWDTLKDYSRFSAMSSFNESAPTFWPKPEPTYAEPMISFFDKLLGRKRRKLADASNLHRDRMEEWRKEQAEAKATYRRSYTEWEQRKTDHERRFAEEKAKFEAERRAANAKVDALAAGVKTGEPQSVIEHATIVLENSDYGNLFEKSFEIDYLPADKTAVVEYQLPSPDDMPTLKAARFIPATDEIREMHISEREQKANYDLACYQICLRTVHELLEADEFRNIERVLFNGFATFVDRKTGRDTTSCIMSVLVNRTDFETIDLARIDPKACFKSLKGVSASSLAALVPVPPVMKLNKEDRRFIEARSAVDALHEAVNLAAMDWEDFEHLVRELFEKEFSTRGGEVKITQSSSDGGVDAVAFDPDPITGGKIVIQAKRYTRTVGVAAVRDLYGTMQHEGASRGVLITTADYGLDAYKFATGKPITLFGGANLLHLLEKHGYNAKIDLLEARKQLSLRDYG